MHTILVIVAGLALLAVCLAVARAMPVAAPAERSLRITAACRWFIALWLVGAGINLWVGVSQAGYGVADELPVFGVVFAAPAIVALVISRRAMRAFVRE